MMHVRVPNDSTVEFFSIRAPLYSARPPIDSGDLTPVADPIAKLTRECSALRLRLATAERRERISLYGSSAPSSAHTPPPYTLTLPAPHALDTAHINAHRDAVRSQVQIEAMKLAERYKVLEKTLRDVQEALRSKDREIESLKKERDRIIAERDHERTRNRALSQSLAQAASKHAETKLQAQHTHQNGADRHSRNRDQSRSRHQAVRKTDELPPVPPPAPHVSADAEHIARTRSMDVYLTKTDSWSGAQVIQAVEDLNAEINQYAASATESCAFAKCARGQGAGLQEHEGAAWLGASFVRVLATRDHTQDPILVQLALQASIATCAARSLSLFCVGFPAKLDALLSRVLAHMQASEPQATAARWRALTHRSIRMLYPGLEEYAISELVATMLRWSATVFVLSGSSPTADAAPAPLVVLSAQLRRIAEAVYKLAWITREEILSTSFEVVLVPSGDAFEDGRMTNKMRDYEACLGEEDGNDGSHARGMANGGAAGKVLCTTELGLRCVTRKANSACLQEEGGEDELFESRTLLMPKVVLDSAVDAIERG
ncbi:hypothetical protein B0H21DRAFT_438941 [Amylocystis lapponica]|nr:hypothetical protein B0H21DRAFT_438941 [Amylocystis lapponica]